MTHRRRTKVPHYGPSLTLTLIVSEDIETLLQRREPQMDFECTGGGTFLDWPDCTIMLREDYTEINTITHEVAHAVHKILRHAGIIECDESEEAYCYLNGWMNDWVLRSLEKFGLLKIERIQSPPVASNRESLGIPPKIKQASS